MYMGITVSNTEIRKHVPSICPPNGPSFHNYAAFSKVFNSKFDQIVLEIKAWGFGSIKKSAYLKQDKAWPLVIEGYDEDMQPKYNKRALIEFFRRFGITNP
jgi:hypothetical protein